jgi:hypothetical protein
MELNGWTSPRGSAVTAPAPAAPEPAAATTASWKTRHNPSRSTARPGVNHRAAGLEAEEVSSDFAAFRAPQTAANHPRRVRSRSGSHQRQAAIACGKPPPCGDARRRPAGCRDGHLAPRRAGDLSVAASPAVGQLDVRICRNERVVPRRICAHECIIIHDSASDYVAAASASESFRIDTLSQIADYSRLRWADVLGPMLHRISRYR